ncbi:MAG: hypothetical protein DMG94_12725 [Acidobacteria bacterium]|nr:MAG: hypothetical protein DMG94_12725 [Acidobacteriota bacterium]
MKRPDLNIALGTLFGAGVAGGVAVALAGRSWLPFGILVGIIGGWLIATLKRWQYRGRTKRLDDSPRE